MLFRSPPGARQLDQLELLYSWKAKLRLLSPSAHPSVAHHSMTWLLDRALYACGSANGTENSLNRCIEAVLWTTKSSEICVQVADEFEQRWDVGPDVTRGDMDTVRAKKINRRSPSVARGAAASSSRATTRGP